MKERFKVIPAVYILLKEDDKILMLERAGTGYFDGYYSLPAGHLDGGETAKAAAAREAKEEIDVDLKPANLKLVHTMHRQVDDSDRYGDERMDLFFEATNWHGRPRNAEPHKCSDLSWWPLDKLPDSITPEVQFALGRIAAGENYSDFNF